MSESKEFITQSNTFIMDQIKTTLGIITYLFLVVLSFVVLNALFPDLWIVWLFVYGIVFIFSLFLLIRWHTNNFSYRCSRCDHEFRISFVTNLISPHGPNKTGGWKYLKCPQCQKRTRAAIIRIKQN